MKQKLLSFIVLCTLIIGVAHAQNRTVTGKVTNSGGEALPGASVQLAGSTNATQTNAEGQYTITVPQQGTLIVKSLGYAEQRTTLSSSNQVNFTLEELNHAVDEVVVVAYGSVKREDFTGSAVTVNSASIEKRPVSNPLVALQGAGPGVQTSTPGGAPGSSPTIRIRGIGSYSASSSPLYVVDGVPFDGGFANINPDDVESISVLKDAATIAMYGNRGANGVVMVTTKTGKGGRNTIDFRANFGVNQNGVPNYDVVDAGEYYELMWQAYTNNLTYGSSAIPIDIARQIGSGTLERNSNGLQVYNGATFQDIVQYLGNYNAFNVPNDQLVSVNGQLNPNAQIKYINAPTWEDEATRNGKRNDYNLTYSSSFGKSDIYGSFNYLDEQGWGHRSSLNRYQGRINGNSQLTKWMKIGLNLSAGSNLYNSPADGGGINNPFSFSRTIAPIYPVYLHDPSTGEIILNQLGERQYDYGNFVADYGLSRPYNSGRHAIAETMMNMDKSARDFVNARATIDFTILPWLTFSTNFTPDLMSSRAEGYENTEVGDGAPAGRYNQSWYRQFSYTFNQLIRTNNTFGKHNLIGTLGHEAYSYKNETISGLRQGQGFENFYVFSNFTDINSLSSGLTETSLESYFGRGEYNYDSKYYVSAMFRYDGSSKIPQINRWANFWSIGGAWRIDQESFFKNEYTDLLKLRASYGKLGNADIGSYPFQAGFGIGRNNGSYPGSALTSLGSPEILWESQYPLDIAIDFSFLKGRITGALEYYRKDSKGLLFSVPQPLHNGGNTGGGFSVDRNVGNMYNTGFEASVTGNLVRKPDFNWNLTLNATTLKNKITKMPEETPEIVSSPYKRQEGYSIYEYFTRTYYGVDPDNGRALYLGLQEDIEFDPSNVNHKLITNANGQIDTVTYDHNAARQDWIGKSALPTVYGSIVNDFSFKGIDFGFVITYSLGGYAMDGRYTSYMSSGPSNGSTLHRDLFGAWKNPGDQTDIPLMDLGRTAQNGAASTRWLEKADYINISNIYLGYRLPASVTNRIGINRAKLILNAENLSFWTARKGFNTLNGITGSAGAGTYNLARTINFGINFGF